MFKLPQQVMTSVFWLFSARLGQAASRLDATSQNIISTNESDQLHRLRRVLRYLLPTFPTHPEAELRLSTAIGERLVMLPTGLFPDLPDVNYDAWVWMANSIRQHPTGSNVLSTPFSLVGLRSSPHSIRLNNESATPQNTISTKESH